MSTETETAQRALEDVCSGRQLDQIPDVYHPEFRLKILSQDSPTTSVLAAELSGLRWLSRLLNGKGGITGRRTTRDSDDRE